MPSLSGKNANIEGLDKTSFVGKNLGIKLSCWFLLFQVIGLCVVGNYAGDGGWGMRSIRGDLIIKKRVNFGLFPK